MNTKIPKKIKRFQDLVNPGGEKDLVIDEDDYVVMQDILKDPGIPRVFLPPVARIEEVDEERRVASLSLCGSLFVSLPPSIGQLQDLREFRLSHADNDLYDLPEEIRVLASLTESILTFSWITTLPSSIWRLKYLEVLNLAGTERLLNLPEEIGGLVSLKRLCISCSGIRSLPSSIGRLTNLKYLNLECSCIESLPSSIGRLVNLEDLNLGYTKRLLNLPEEIGDLASLEILSLAQTQVTSLPSSIGRLANLKDLNLARTERLWNLPEEIGDLASLEKLDFELTDSISSLPSSIGRLANLKDLNLWYANELVKLPKEIGDLVSLNKLNLRDSGIMSLPSSIGRLTNLKDLDLSYTKRLLNLPDEIGALVGLNKMNLRDSWITSLPSSIGNMTNLRDLDLTGTLNLHHLPAEILDMADLRCRFDDWGQKNECEEAYEESRVCASCPIAKQLCYAIARNEARSRTGLGTGTTDSDNHNNDDSVPIQMPSTLWPLVLRNATRAFEHPYTRYVTLQQPDAIYQLICDGRESFLGVVLNRGNVVPHNRDSRLTKKQSRVGHHRR